MFLQSSSNGDVVAAVVAGSSMLAAVWLMAHYGAKLTQDKNAHWQKKFFELETAYSYLLKSLREIEASCTEAQARQSKEIAFLNERVKEMVDERRLGRINEKQMAAEIDALRKVLASQT